MWAEYKMGIMYIRYGSIETLELPLQCLDTVHDIKHVNPRPHAEAHLGTAVAYKEKAKLTATKPDLWEAVQCFTSTSKMIPEDSEFQFLVHWNFAELLSLVADFGGNPQLKALGRKRFVFGALLLNILQ